MLLAKASCTATFYDGGQVSKILLMRSSKSCLAWNVPCKTCFRQPMLKVESESSAENQLFGCGRAWLVSAALVIRGLRCGMNENHVQDGATIVVAAIG